MYLAEKRQFMHVVLHPWTDGKRTLFGSLWADGWIHLWANPKETETPTEILSEPTCLERFTPVLQGVQYVVGILEHTWYCYWGPEGWTTEPDKMTIFDSLDEAEKVFKSEHGDFIEAVTDVEEFRHREDTW